MDVHINNANKIPTELYPQIPNVFYLKHLVKYKFTVTKSRTAIKINPEMIVKMASNREPDWLTFTF